MSTVTLARIADARSGDKGEGSNVGVMPRSQEAYVFLREHLTIERVQEHMRGINRGDVVRYEGDGLRVLNFILSDSLGGGGSASLRTDAQGKTHALALLRMQIDVPQRVLDVTPHDDAPGGGKPPAATPEHRR